MADGGSIHGLVHLALNACERRAITAEELTGFLVAADEPVELEQVQTALSHWVARGTAVALVSSDGYTLYMMRYRCREKAGGNG